MYLVCKGYNILTLALVEMRANIGLSGPKQVFLNPIYCHKTLGTITEYC